MLDTETLSKVLGKMKTGIECEDNKDNQFREIDYRDVCSAFGVLGLGCMLALGNSLLEFMFNNKFVSIRKVYKKDLQ